MKLRIEKGKSIFAGIMPKQLPIESETEYHKLMIVEDLLEIMDKKGITRKELACRMSVAPSRVTSMLNSTNNFTIETMVRAGRAVDATLKQTLVPVEK